MCAKRNHPSRFFPWLPAVLLLVGCSEMGDILSGTTKPEARIQDVNLTGLGLDGADLVFDVAIVNPYGVPLPVGKLDYALASEGSPFLQGQSDFQGTVPANGTRTVPIEAKVAFPQLLSALSGVRPGEVVPYQAELGISVDAPGLGTVRLPVRHEGGLPIPTVPEVALQSVDWRALSLTGAEAVLHVRLGNRNTFPLDLQDLAYSLSLAGSQILSSHVEGGGKVGAGQGDTLDIPISFSPASLGVAALNILRGTGASYDMSGTLSAGTPYGPLTLPFSGSGRTTFTR